MLFFFYLFFKYQIYRNILQVKFLAICFSHEFVCIAIHLFHNSFSSYFLQTSLNYHLYSCYWQYMSFLYFFTFLFIHIIYINTFYFIYRRTRILNFKKISFSIPVSVPNIDIVSISMWHRSWFYVNYVRRWLFQTRIKINLGKFDLCLDEIFKRQLKGIDFVQIK